MCSFRSSRVCHLRRGKMRPGEPLRAIHTITQKMLTQQLRELENEGIVHREVYGQGPPRFVYW
ncbi:helix-turn-helix domain-containing protein [Lacticaseibacillus pantheris]|uniref:winged helix-turn-helix transcriptional regulator n=1 Tax=uncultured Lacticaseibacillus sp. TaxID=2775882 RepID=UPI0023B86597|nr:winged helix-turn-helix transcriptional regulator [Lacticaseibacillus pantheris]WKF83946.1 winged helix-turn-helix transcriptional regulator [Lacticaseibacillus pantheris]